MNKAGRVGVQPTKQVPELGNKAFIQWLRGTMPFPMFSILSRIQNFLEIVLLSYYTPPRILS
jgi:hypothetical protein